MSPICSSGVPFFEKKILLRKLWGCGREARECGQPVGNARRKRPVDGESAERVVHGLSTRPEGRAPVRGTRPQIHSVSVGAPPCPWYSRRSRVRPPGSPAPSTRSTGKYSGYDCPGMLGERRKMCATDWRNALIEVCGRSRRQTALPLPQEVGDAILAYLEHARPRVPQEAVFLRDRKSAPCGSRTLQSTGWSSGRRSSASQGWFLWSHLRCTESHEKTTTCGPPIFSLPQETPHFGRFPTSRALNPRFPPQRPVLTPSRRSRNNSHLDTVKTPQRPV